jgi:sec-independent protein translocase protein TatA
MLGLSFQELLIIGVVAVLLFGKNLPDVAKKFGGMYRDFRKSLDDLRSQVDFAEAFNSTPARSKPKPSYSDFDDNDEITAPKFQPPPPPSSDLPAEENSQAS